MPDDDVEFEEGALPSRSVWSGAISFGLLSLPVDLFPASRSRAPTLKLIDAKRRTLARRYTCPVHERFLSRDEIVRGYEIEKDRFVIVTDSELESVEPEKSRTIDLRIFVKASEIDPMYFKRSYFLTPGEGGLRAYRLLAATMERSVRVGVASFVMRGKEHLVALLSEGGILRAETLRFAEELRSPADVGLGFGEAARPPAAKVAALRRAMSELETEQLAGGELEDAYTERLRALIDRKLERGIDVEKAPEPEAEPEEAEIIDLMEVLKRRLQPSIAQSAAAAGNHSAEGKRAAEGSREGERGRRTGAKAAPGGSGRLDRLSKDQLYEQAKALRVPGRSKMDREQLIEALRRLRA
ncbi:MAG TPA: Ku protein [Gammaproteobacteria bacterium]|nr:Ku protein [Gammaproteobacteria bacterium]